MGVNAMLPAVLFAVLMLSCLFACYVVAVRREDVQAWIPFISDMGLRGPEHFIFSQCLNMAAYVGIAMIFLRFKTIASRAYNDVCTKSLSILSLIVGLLAALFLSFIANFPEGQLHGVGTVHFVSAGILFTGGCVFIVLDTVVTLLMRWVEIRNEVQFPRQHWRRSLRWFEWLRPIIAVLSVPAFILALTGLKLSTKALDPNGANATVISPHHWKPDEPGYALHVQGAVGEWLMGIFFVIYTLLFLPEFRRFTIDVKLQPVNEVHELGQPGEHTRLIH